MSKAPKFLAVAQYENKDDFGGDEFGVYLEIDGKKVVDYGDYYHDKGSEKVVGFVDGYCFALGIKPPGSLKWIDRCDYEY